MFSNLGLTGSAIDVDKNRHTINVRKRNGKSWVKCERTETHSKAIVTFVDAKQSLMMEKKSVHQGLFKVSWQAFIMEGVMVMP